MPTALATTATPIVEIIAASMGREVIDGPGEGETVVDGGRKVVEGGDSGTDGALGVVTGVVVFASEDGLTGGLGSDGWVIGAPVERRAHSADDRVRMFLSHVGFHADAMAGDG